ncbi:MAG: glycoside hydrolase family 95 protein [Muribaculaceae bacterium]|nr:glycoside hydrolase family 95 protein [Muribaculaceae bacterium]
MKIKGLTIATVLAVAAMTEIHADAPLELRYSWPAQEWVEALPVGNSRMGAMIYGGVEQELIKLNDETFWAGGPHNNNSAEGLAYLDKIRSLIFEGKEKEAEVLIDKHYFTGQHGMSFLPLGTLKIDFAHGSDVTDYSRRLDISEAKAEVSYTVSGVKYTRETIASLPDGVIAVRLTADKPGTLGFSLSYELPDQGEVTFNGNEMDVTVDGRDQEGVKAALTAKCGIAVETKSGKVSDDGKSLKVEGADDATIYIASATNFVKYNDVSGDAAKAVRDRLDAAIAKGYARLIADHTTAYKKQFDRVKLTLPKGEKAGEETLERLTSFGDTYDPSFIELLFQYGRYLLISSSQPGGQPANLQGVWNESLTPPWDSKYTININAEMNYWPAEVTNLSECHEPLFDLIADLSVTGDTTATVLYGADGWVAHHNTDLWRICGPVDMAIYGMWPNGGAWLATHLWEHYLFTEDMDFLRKYYPVIKGTADFFLSTLVEDPATGYLVTSPSGSPEHGYGESCITAGCTMDNQIARDALNNTRLAGELLGEDAEYLARLEQTISRLNPMRVGKYGQLQEWNVDADDPTDDHRHVSHLYGLYPSNQITPSRTPDEFKAAAVTLTQRGDMATGWSIGWKINLWARLLDGEHADKIIRNFVHLLPTRGTGITPNGFDGRLYANLFDAHPPFQIDGNFGFTAGVAEMLVQSHDDAIFLLPALPSSWNEGEVSGLRGRGGKEIGIKWADGKLKTAEIKADKGGKMRVRTFVELLEEDGLKEVQTAEYQIAGEPKTFWEYEVEMAPKQVLVIKAK